MNIPNIIIAVESLDLAIAYTIDPDERGKLASINRRLRRMLRKRGLFLGQPEQPTRKEG